jgi:hypothetical protein
LRQSHKDSPARRGNGGARALLCADDSAARHGDGGAREVLCAVVAEVVVVAFVASGGVVLLVRVCVLARRAVPEGRAAV